MPFPAARLGDSTAHGGVIVVGFPTVLIAGQPAACAGDMHTCPLVNGVVPHVVADYRAGVAHGAHRRHARCTCHRHGDLRRPARHHRRRRAYRVDRSLSVCVHN
ncbi:MAG: PAAR domain-containing protein [Caldilineaceae bacterium]